MAPKNANKAKAVLKKAKGEFAEALQEAYHQEACADEQSMAEAGKAVLKRPAAAADVEENLGSQRKMLKRPAAAVTAAEECDAEELANKAAEQAPQRLKRPAAVVMGEEAAEGAVEVDEAEVGEDEGDEDDEDAEDMEDEDEAQKVMKKPSAATTAKPRRLAEEAPSPKRRSSSKTEEAARAAKANDTAAANAVPAPTTQVPKREKQPKPVSRTQELINAVHSTISSIVHKASPAAGVKLHPGALTTFDEEGFPSTRTVIPHYIADDLTEVHVTSQAGTRKESELSANPKASLHFQDQRGKGGWATLKGQAAVRPTDNSDKVEIVLRLARVEIMSYNEHIMGDVNGWKPATMIMTSAGIWRRVDTGAAASA